MAERYIGVMSGTSVDAIDAVLCEIQDNGQVQYEGVFSLPIDTELANRLHQAMTPQSGSLIGYKQLEQDYSRAVVDAVDQLLLHHRLSASDITALGCHGQTLWHHPPGPDAPAPFSLQLINAAYIAFHSNIDVISDFRQNDVVAGGQGAPLVPAFHYHALGQLAGSQTVVLNLGGIANMTWLGANEQEVLGFDTGPANTLLDAYYRQHVAAAGFDEKGQLAASGQCIRPLLSGLLENHYFSRLPPKSTGREQFNLDWLQPFLSGTENHADVLATLTELTAHSAANAMRLLPKLPKRVIACGGGVHNGHLMQALQRQLGAIPVQTTADYQLDPQAIEGMAFAWLAWCYEHKKPGNLPAVTGAKCPVILGTKTLAPR